MALLPARFQNTDDMPMSLGKAIARAIIAPPCEFHYFETGNHGLIPAPKESATASYIVTEADCRQIKGAAQVLRSESVQTRPLGTTPEAAPPSAQKFKVGDRVRAGSFGDGVVVHINPNDQRPIFKCEFVEPAVVSCFYAETLELIPAPEPAATPVALGDGWLDCGPDMPDLPAGRYELRAKKRPEQVMRPNGKWSLRLNVRSPEAIASHQYRKVLA